MRGISKEMPWPGSRCGWIEVYNGHNDPLFERYVASILNSKMVEVCSTTLPQKALPLLTSHPEYPFYLQERIDRYEKYSNIAYEALKDLDSVIVNRTNGAFYMSLAFEEGSLTHSQTLPMKLMKYSWRLRVWFHSPGRLLISVSFITCWHQLEFAWFR